MIAAKPGALVVAIHDEQVVITMSGGGEWTIPLGPRSLVDGPLEQRDQPAPSQLTNALGFIHDYFDDIVVAAPMVLATPSVTAIGEHALALAHVEIGASTVPPDYQLQRADADEVFRTLVAEPRSERVHNPGLDAEAVDTVIGTLCIVLSIMRRLDLSQMAIRGGMTDDQNSTTWR